MPHALLSVDWPNVYMDQSDVKVLSARLRLMHRRRCWLLHACRACQVLGTPLDRLGWALSALRAWLTAWPAWRVPRAPSA